MEKIITNGVESRELWFTDEFFPKVTERLQIMLNCIANKTEIQDADYEVLQEVHKWWFEGKFNWHKSIVTPESIIIPINQQDLFSQEDRKETLDILNNKGLDILAIEQINEESK